MVAYTWIHLRCQHGGCGVVVVVVVVRRIRGQCLFELYSELELRLGYIRQFLDKIIKNYKENKHELYGTCGSLSTVFSWRLCVAGAASLDSSQCDGVDLWL